MNAGVECLLQNRNEVGVYEVNSFIFVRTSGLNGVDVHSCMKKVVGFAKLDKPNLVTSTYLRKHIAMVFQLLVSISCHVYVYWCKNSCKNSLW